MQNQLQMECYFKSSALAELCQAADDIVITCKVIYQANEPPSFEITANAYPASGDAGSKPGCPQPCP